MKNIFNRLKNCFRIGESDYTPSMYLVRVSGYMLALLGVIITFFDIKKRNYFTLKREELIQRYDKMADIEFNKKFLKNDIYNFRGIYLPIIRNTSLMRYVYQDSLKIYTERNDNYDYKIVDEVDKTIPEGSYCYVGPNGEDITVRAGYTVLDVGAWIGDFSAYASKKGAHAYAFEPSPANIKLLEKTVEYNKGNGGTITVVPYGLGDREDTLEFLENDDDDNTSANTFNVPSGKGNTRLHITTIDTFVEKNNIPTVDFIKADIEGYERLMLKGAQKTLKKHEPILSLCTYHYPDDPEVLKEIILQANPRYNIIQRKKKMFAYVNKN